MAHHSGLALARLGSGWESLGEVSSEATFPRAFDVFAEDHLPQARNWGTRKDSKGERQTWRGYKLHLDVADGDLPHTVPQCCDFAA